MAGILKITGQVWIDNPPLRDGLAIILDSANQKWDGEFAEENLKGIRQYLQDHGTPQPGLQDDELTEPEPEGGIVQEQAAVEDSSEQPTEGSHREG